MGARVPTLLSVSGVLNGERDMRPPQQRRTGDGKPEEDFHRWRSKVGEKLIIGLSGATWVAVRALV
jgi:hypothetical protein